MFKPHAVIKIGKSSYRGALFRRACPAGLQPERPNESSMDLEISKDS